MSTAANSAPVDAQTGRRVVLSAENVSKYYGNVTALDSVSWTLGEGEIVALVGDNGAGKSTMISILNGIVQPDGGVLRLDGEEIMIDSPRHAQDLGIATVFQDLALVNQRDVAANLFLGREPRKFGIVVDRRKMVAEASKAVTRLRVGMPNVRALAGDLSGGQRQAVAVARSIVGDCRVLLLDEPTAALGVRESRRVVEFIKELRGQGGMSTLLISHNMEHVFELADRVVVFRQGKKVGERVIAETSMDEVVGLIVGNTYGDQA
jgi:ABC-type sugar transport system ATPase subunit